MEPFTLLLAAILIQTETAAPPPPPPLPSPAHMASGDADRDGVRTRAEWQAEFDRLDTDHDGRLTREEARAGRAPRGGPDARGFGGGRRRAGGTGAMLPPGTTREAFLARAAERFDRIDSNRNGRIDPDERRTPPGGPDEDDAPTG